MTVTGGNRSPWRNPCSNDTSSAANIIRTGPVSNRAFAMRGRRDRSNTQINLRYIYIYIYKEREREMFILYLTENTVPSIVKNCTKRKSGSSVLPSGT
jgi:hypothetical protein